MWNIRRTKIIDEYHIRSYLKILSYKAVDAMVL